MQLHFYVPDDVGAGVKKRAAASGVPVSRYLADLVLREVGQGWPEKFFEKVVGGWHGPPPERPEQGEPEARDMF